MGVGIEDMRTYQVNRSRSPTDPQPGLAGEPRQLKRFLNTLLLRARVTGPVPSQR